MKKSKIIILFFLVMFIGIMSIYYCLTAYQYKTKYIRGTTINNIDVSLKTQDEVQKILTEKQYIINIKEKDIEYSIDLTDIGTIEYDEDQIKNIFTISNDNKLLYSKNKSYTITPIVSIDKDKLIKEVDNAYKNKRTENQDAYIKLENNNFVIEKEKQGNILNYDNLLNLLVDSIENNTFNIELNDECYQQPKITSKDLEEQCKKYNDSINIEIKIDCKKNQEETISVDTLAKWIEKDKNNQYVTNKNGYLKFDESKIKEYIETLSKKYNTYGNTEKFITNAGDEIELSSSFYGWKIDEEQSFNVLKETLSKYQDANIELIYSQTAAEADNNIGNTYLEVSIKDQHWWYYENGKVVVESDCVTGNYSSIKSRTDTGLTYVINKERDKTLRGAGYASFVNYWIQVNYDGEGVHDASWRSSYGGSIYLTNGSHGCINTPKENVGKLYEKIQLYTPVIIY